MNILILNMSNTYNYGAMMMGENLISFLNNKLKNVNFYIDARADEHVERLRKATSCENIYRDKILTFNIITNRINGIRSIERKIRENKAFKKCGKFYNAVIVLGGDDYAETYHKIPEENWAVFHALKRLERINSVTKLFMIGQTIGPYTGERLDYAKTVFKNIKIYTRDSVSAKYLNDNEIPCSVAKDIAFLPLTLQDKYELKYNLVNKEYIVIVGTGLFSSYSSNTDLLIRKFDEIVSYIRNRFPNKKLVYLTHVLNKDYGDNLMYERLNNKDLFDLVLNDKMLPVEARLLLGSSYFNLTCRMHPGVSSFQMGVPAICLSYSVKYEGVISEGLGLSELVIDAKGEDKWENIVIHSVKEKIDYIENNYEDLNRKIMVAVDNCKIEVEEMLNAIAGDING